MHLKTRTVLKLPTSSLLSMTPRTAKRTGYTLRFRFIIIQASLKDTLKSSLSMWHRHFCLVPVMNAINNFLAVLNQYSLVAQDSVHSRSENSPSIIALWESLFLLYSCSSNISAFFDTRFLHSLLEIYARTRTEVFWNSNKSFKNCTNAV